MILWSYKENYPYIISNTLIICFPLAIYPICTIMILSFRTDRSGQKVQTQIRLLIEEQSDQGLHCLSFRLCIVWTHYSMIEPHSSNFGVITKKNLNVRIFRKIMVCSYYVVLTFFAIEEGGYLWLALPWDLFIVFYVTEQWRNPNNFSIIICLILFFLTSIYNSWTDSDQAFKPITGKMTKIIVANELVWQVSLQKQFSEKKSVFVGWLVGLPLINLRRFWDVELVKSNHYFVILHYKIEAAHNKMTCAAWASAQSDNVL